LTKSANSQEKEGRERGFKGEKLVNKNLEASEAPSGSECEMGSAMPIPENYDERGKDGRGKCGTKMGLEGQAKPGNVDASG